MRKSLAPQLDHVKPQPLGMTLEAPSKKWSPSPADFALAGKVFADMLHHARLTDQEATEIMGYSDQSQITKWKKGEGLPVFFVRLIANERTREGLPLAIGDADPNDRVHTHRSVSVGGRR